jgi:hypothetical protein
MRVYHMINDIQYDKRLPHDMHAASLTQSCVE